MAAVSAAAAPRIGYYGDDFTGATDTLATAARGGLRTVLFLGVPDAARLAAAGPLDCVGIAGAARAMAPQDMAAELAPVADFFTRLRTPLLHYKLCSTFDSAVHVGNVAVALQALRPGRPNPLVAIVGGQPSLGRYCVFGNLYAAEQAGGPPRRLDRHRNMSRHPVTPMDEADLRLHLARQGLSPMAAMHYPDYDLDDAAQDARLEALLAEHPQAVLFDAGHDSHLRHIGRMLWRRAQAQPLLAAGASSVVQALLAHWDYACGQDSGTQDRADTPARDDRGRGDRPQQGRKNGVAAGALAFGIAPAEGPVLVLAGSMSPVTAMQIAASTSYQRIALDAARLAADDAGYAEAAANDLCAALQGGRSVLAYTTPLDGQAGSAARASTRQEHASRVMEPPKSHRDGSACPIAAADLARASAALLRRVLQRCTGLKRIGVAGGDTSSRAMQALDIWGLRYAGAPAPGVALCRALADDAALDGMEIMLKGGQMGPPQLFESLLHGTR